MHRSGTSAVTRALGLLGLPLGPEEQLQEEWENEPLLRLNERILRRLGGAWGAPPDPPARWWALPEIVELEDPAREALAGAFPTGPFAWKDPRLCLTLPFWRPLLGGEPVAVMVVRHPLEVAASLERRDGFAPERSVALWEVYQRGAMQNAAGLRAVVVQYADLLDDPAAGCVELEAALRGLGFEPEGGDAIAAAGSLEGDRRHHQATGPAPERHLSEEQRELWRVAQGTGRAHQAFVVPALPPLTPESGRIIADLRAGKQEHRSRRRAVRLAGARLRKLRRAWRGALRKLGLARGPRRAAEMLGGEGLGGGEAGRENSGAGDDDGGADIVSE